MKASPVFVLIHSPLVGALTWSAVAGDLRTRGLRAVVPVLAGAEEAGPPYWRRHVEAIESDPAEIDRDRPLVLVGHSGAGVLLPAIRQVTRRPVAAYLFADALIPEDGKSRLDVFESPEASAAFRRAAPGGVLPVWTGDDLREAIPDPGMRRRVVAELRPLPLAVYEEPIPVFPAWPDAPCGYLLFSRVYRPAAEQARRRGWTVADLPGGHFHMLVDPGAVARALLEMLARMEVAAR